MKKPPAERVEEVGYEGLARGEPAKDGRAEERVAEEEDEREVGRSEEVEVLEDNGILLEEARRHIGCERASRIRGRVAAADTAAVDRIGCRRTDRHAPSKRLLAAAINAVDVFVVRSGRSGGPSKGET